MTHDKSVARRVCTAPHACPVLAACQPETRTPCLDLSRAHAAKQRLCEQLEAIADSLPSRVDRLLCLRIANELVPRLRESHRYEEGTIFPAFLKGAREERVRAASVRRLETEHIQDECAAQDLTDMLMSVGHGAPVANPEALGFMLRAFFDSLRRHIAFEREHLLPQFENLPTGFSP